VIRGRSGQALKYLGSSVLLLCVFEACSTDDAATPNPFKEPPTLEIADISLGNGSSLACDNTISVTLALSNWKLYPPGKCGSTPQCGQVRVSLLDGPSGKPLLSQAFASVGANLNVGQLVESDELRAGSYAIQAELIDDAGHVYQVMDGGNDTAERTFTLSLSAGCAPGSAGASAGGASGEGGMGGAFFETGGSGAALAGAAGAPVR